MLLDYEVLRLIWWALLIILLAGFAITDGFDLGVLIISPFIAKTDVERRILINTIGPVWEGNQVWLILGAGAIFAAWPFVYAVAFSGFYFALFLALIGLILRPVGIKFRSKVNHPKWKTSWDWILCVSSVLPALIFGVAIGNLFLGIPFYFNENLNMFYTGNFWGLLTPFAVLCGLVSLVMIIMQGSMYLTIKTERVLARKSTCTAQMSCGVLLILLTLAGVWLIFMDGYHIIEMISHTAPSNPLTLDDYVLLQQGAWLNNYNHYPLMLFAPIITYMAGISVFIFLHYHYLKQAFIASSITLLSIIATAGVSLFPFFMPSSVAPNQSLTLWNASSSHLTLWIMLLATLIFLPIILAYTAWVYRVLRGKVTEKTITEDKHTAY